MNSDETLLSACVHPAERTPIWVSDNQEHCIPVCPSVHKKYMAKNL